MIIGIDVSRNRSGGAKAHIIGILKEFDETLLKEIREIHIWGYSELLAELPKKKWIIKHCPKVLSKSIFHQLWWQYQTLPKEAKNFGIDIMFNTDAGSLCPFSPSVTLSQDMLSYEKGEINRYGFGLKRVRLELLKYVQNKSLKNATSALFLTDYAANIIQTYTGKLIGFNVIPHGVNQSFNLSDSVNNRYDLLDGKAIKCVYVSNVDLYKHQWNVARSIHHLRDKGYNITCTFIGGGSGKAQSIFDKTLQSIPSSDAFLEQMNFIPHKELPALLRKFDIFIFASSCENMPITLIEGMSTGLPIASSNRGPMPEFEVIIPGVTGLFFEKDNIIDLTNKIYEWLTLATERSQIRQDCYKIVDEKYNPHYQVRVLKNYYENTSN